jgi:hypothetical protein
MIALPDDTARCIGSQIPNSAELREPCKDCRRREPTFDRYRAWMMASAVVNGECEYRIQGETRI